MHGHSKEHGHGHGHGHSHGHGAAKRILFIAVFLTLGFAGIEALAGWWAGSLALLSDAGHMVSDSLALALAAFAAWISHRPPSDKHTYGYGRAEVIAAWLSSLFLLIVIIGIVIEAIYRFQEPHHEVAGGAVMIVGSVGLAVNIFIAWLLSRGERTLNVRAAILHVMGDVLGSIAAIVSGAVIYFTDWTLIDPILSIFIAALILISSLRILRESLAILMEGVPLHIELSEVGRAMVGVEKVYSIHDLHIWTLSSGKIALSAHVEIDDANHWKDILRNLRELLAEKFAINHVTLQPEINVEVLQPIPYPEDRKHQH